MGSWAGADKRSRSDPPDSVPTRPTRPTRLTSPRGLLTCLPALLGLFAAYRAIAYVAGADMARHRVESAWIWFGAAAVAGALVLAVRRTNPAPAKRTRISAGLGLVLIALALLTFWPATTIGLLSDDFVLISWAARGELMPSEWPHIRVLPLAVWRLALWVGGPLNAPVLLHVCGIVLHGINGALVSRLAIATGAAPASAMLAAVVFVVSPIAVEPIAWLSAMPDLMVTTLVLAAVIVALTVRDRGRASVITLGLVVAALCTKENALIAGPLLLVTTLVATRADRRRVIQIGVAATTVSAAYFLWRLGTGRIDRIDRSLDRLTIKNFLTGPFAVLGLPLHGGVIESGRLFAAGWMTAIAAVVVVASTGWRMTPHLARRTLFAALWILVALLPAYGVFAVMDDLQGSRYLYLSAVGWCIGIASLLELFPLGRIRVIATTLMVIGAVAAGIAGARAHLEIWQGAARARDQILSSALALSSSCRQISIVNTTDEVRGAYVFRNGLAEALAFGGRRLEIRSDDAVPPECRVDAARVSPRP